MSLRSHVYAWQLGSLGCASLGMTALIASAKLFVRSSSVTQYDMATIALIVPLSGVSQAGKSAASVSSVV